MDYFNSCRLCLSTEGQQLPIFGSATCGIESLDVRILSYLSIEVSQFDGLPKQICHRCECQVNLWHYFKKECDISQRKLGRWLQTLLSPSVERGNEVEECEVTQEGVHIKLEPEEFELNDDVDINNTDLAFIPNTGYRTPTETVDSTNNQCADSIENLGEQNYKSLDASSNDLNLVISGTSSVAVSSCPPDEGDSVVKECTNYSFYNTRSDIEGDNVFVGTANLDGLDGDASLQSTTFSNKDTTASPNFHSKDLLLMGSASDGCPKEQNPAPDSQEQFIGSAEVSLKIKREILDETDTDFQQLQSTQKKQSFLIYNFNSADLPKINNDLYDENTKTCKICKKTYPRSNLWRHMKTFHAKEKPFQCPACHKDFPGRRELVTHRVRTVSKYCRAGKEPEVPLSSLIVHNEVKRGKYECRQCKVKFSLLSCAKSHLRIHAGEMPFFCFKCNEREFQHRKSAIKHVTKCKGKRDEAFSKDNVKHARRVVSVTNLLKQKVVKQVKMDKIHKCGKCEKVFSNGVGIANHLRTECKKRCFSCSKLVPVQSYYKHYRQCFKSMHSSPSRKILEDLPGDAENLQSDLITTSQDTANPPGPEENDSDLVKTSSTPIKRKNRPRLTKINMSLKDLWAKHLHCDGKLKSLTCQLCENTMSSRKSLHAHLLKHSAMAFQCQLCRVTMSSCLSFERHMLAVHGIVQDVSNNDQNSTKPDTLEKARLPGKFSGFLSKLKCDICLKLCSSASSLRFHKMNHKKVKCEKCEITFPATMEKTHVCLPKARTVSSNPENDQDLHQEQPMLPQKGPLSYTCHLCNKKFHTRKMLCQHKKMHIKMKIYKCKMCDNSYRDSGALQQHKEVAHASELVPVKDQNEYGFGNIVKEEHQSVGDKNHVLTGNAGISEDLADIDVSGLKSIDVVASPTFDCSICPRKFTSQKNLKIHVYSHNKPKAPKVVKKENVSPGGKTQTGSLFSCELCSKTFMDSSALSSHLNTHSGSSTDASIAPANTSGESSKQEQLQCNLCNKEYRCKKSLKYHMMGHSGEKPYKCRSCSNQYSNPKALTKHEKERHSIVLRPFCCNRCKTSFILKEDLLAHHQKCTH